LRRWAFDGEREEIFSTVHQEEEDQANASIILTSSRRHRTPSESSVASFETRFQELLKYREIHGHTRVPKREGRLGSWVNKLRQRKDRLNEQRLERLNEIGFCWDASDDKRRKLQPQWWRQLESLRKTQETLSCRTAKSRATKMASIDTGSLHTVPKNQSLLLSFDNLSSSQKTWLRRQRIVYIDSGYKPSEKLDDEQIQALNAIDRNWWISARERKWNAQYSVLKDFKTKHGHCNVTSAHKDKKLFNWVQNTRKNYRAVKFDKYHGLRSDGTPKLSLRQIELLDKIGFNWDPWGHYTDWYESSRF